MQDEYNNTDVDDPVWEHFSENESSFFNEYIKDNQAEFDIFCKQEFNDRAILGSFDSWCIENIDTLRHDFCLEDNYDSFYSFVGSDYGVSKEIYLTNYSLWSDK